MKNIWLQNRQSHPLHMTVMAMPAAMSNVREDAFVLFLCWFVCFLSLQKTPTLLGIETCSSLIADEIKGAVCEWRSTLSDCTTALQSGFARINILKSQHLSVLYSACFIIIININFCHVSCLWFKLVEAPACSGNKRKRWKTSLSRCCNPPAC